MSCEENSKNLNPLQIDVILGMMRQEGYVIFTRPFELNMIGVRTVPTNPDEYDDRMYVLWKDDKGFWKGKEYVVTTDPSTRYLKSPINTLGAAILPSGQYLDKWKLGYHRGKYLALVNSGELCVYRDYDRTAILTFDAESKSCGHYGINIHRSKAGAADDGKGNTRGNYPASAGCQVFRNSYCFEEFMEMAKKHADMYGDSFSYTLFDLSLQRKYLVKKIITVLGVLSGVALVLYGTYLLEDT